MQNIVSYSLIHDLLAIAWARNRQETEQASQENNDT